MKTQHPGLLRDIIGWDVVNWQQALALWEQILPERLNGWRGLELGAGPGGLSLYFGLKGAQMICSDCDVPAAQIQASHQRYGLELEYLGLDAWQALPFGDATLDLVCFKSVLGGLRKGAAHDPKAPLLSEIRRVLKPGGWLLLAENLAGHRLHAELRRRFIRWSAGWEYLELEELLKLLDGFEVHYRTTGLLGLLGRNEHQRHWLGRLDQQLAPRLPSHWHYLFVGAARKKQA